MVIAHNDEALVGEAIRSVLDQGPVVAEVVAVDDGSSDGTARVLDELAALHPRLRVVHRTENSGGCGTPRNDGVRAVTAPVVIFLDSDDILPAGAAEALVAAAELHRAPVAVGACVRRELPEGRDVRWQPALYLEPALLESAADLTPLVHDTLCVNKVYDRAFLAEHGIRFPDGHCVYEDFLFTARVLAAAPRVAVVPDTVYVWHVRRAAAHLSISLDRDGVTNWQARIAAHRTAVETFEAAGRTELAAACRTKFLEHDLRLYARELWLRDAAYRSAWWAAAREHLAGFEEADLAAASPPARWLARLLLAAEAPRDLTRLSRLAGDPARLLGPYARSAGAAVWSEDLPGAELDGVDTLPLAELPVVVDAALYGGRGGGLRFTVRDLYGRVAAAGPRTAQVSFLLRGVDGAARTERAELREVAGGWTGRVPAGLTALARAGRERGQFGTQAWDLRITVDCADGQVVTTAPRLPAERQRRWVLPSSRYGVQLVQQYTTANGSLAVRIAPGARDGFRAVGARLRRLSRGFWPLSRGSSERDLGV
ncbi:glycosyltransferase family 2 protein [Streptomyces sp. P9(2023)]|uniref:glycosyltransferase family 2 protein n=1 Tax=Streptomyces sp. P9(2023) TaxID=3064394 RepID=UPI0028F43FAD|nr:glycosyltransferase family 2 protein [Streptomyces sp. P9(2023)]MDT9690634.1 glycosyltransferase family 2 protein [Streptomyces sp. P9(2023)]